MENSKLEFDTVSMSDLEYKLMELSSISPEDFDTLDKERQLAFVHIKDDMGIYTRLMINVPKAWAEDEAGFRERVKTDLKPYVIDALKHRYLFSLNTIGNMIDHMGFSTFINYVPYDTDDLMETPATPEFRPPDVVQKFMWKLVQECVMEYDLMHDEEFYNETIDNIDVLSGQMAFKVGVVKDNNFNIAEQMQNMKPSLVKEVLAMQIDLSCWYETDCEDPKESYKAWAECVGFQYNEHLRLALGIHEMLEESNGKTNSH